MWGNVAESRCLSLLHNTATKILCIDWLLLWLLLLFIYIYLLFSDRVAVLQCVSLPRQKNMECGCYLFREVKKKNLLHSCKLSLRQPPGLGCSSVLPWSPLHHMKDSLLWLVCVCVSMFVCVLSGCHSNGPQTPTRTGWVCSCPFSNHLQLLLANQQLWLFPRSLARSLQTGKQTENTLVCLPPRLAHLL